MKSRSGIHLFFAIAVLFHSSMVRAQQFTKITTGNIVNTPSGSRSCNFLDVNNDGFQDILITNGTSGGENNMLYINNGDETFFLMNDTIVNDDSPTDGASCADYDNDGFVDVVAVNWYNVDNLQYKNDQGSSFIKVNIGEISTQNGFSETAAWGDYDSDGLIDLYITNSGGSRENFLYKNVGAGVFQSISDIGPVTDDFFSRCANWIDYDGDGDQDLYVTNENGQNNNLYRNDGELVFTDITDNVIVSDNFSSMSSSWGDYDNDGDFDLFVANYQQNNQLFNNDGFGNFNAVPGPWDTEEGCSFSSSFSDYDNDGDLDLFVTNGYCADDLTNYLYFNNGDGTFSKDLTEPMSTDTGGSYGCAWGDYNNDGFMDLVVANWQDETQSNYLYKNNGNDNNWLELDLEGTVSNHSAIGAIVKCKAMIDGNPMWLLREVSSQTGYCSQNSMVVHFGLNDATIVDSLQVVWPSGIIQNFTNLITNEMYSLVENEDLGVTAISNLKKSDIAISIFPNPSGGAFSIEISDLQGENCVIEIFDMNGKLLLAKQILIDSDKISVMIDDLGETIPNGIYTVKVIVNMQSLASRRVVIIQQ